MADSFYEEGRNPILASQLDASNHHIQKVASVAGGSTSGNALAIPGTARQLTAGAATGNVQLTAAVTMISIFANGANIRFAIGGSGVTASATSAFAAQGERQDYAVPAGSYVAAIRDGSVSGVLEITELT